LNMRTRTNIGPSCPAIILTERKWATSWVSPTISNTPTNAAKADFGPSGELLWLVPNGFKTISESITDSLGVDGRFRDCHHTIETNEFFNPVNRTLFPEAAQTNASLGRVTVAMINSLITFSAAPSVDMAAMADEAMAFMLPHVNEGDSLVNFVLELKDVKRSVSKAGIAFSRVFGNPKSLKWFNPRKEASYSDASFKLRPGRKRMLKDILNRLAGAHLEGVYGVSLTVADIVSMYTNLEELKYKLQVLKQYAGRPQVRHYRRFIPASAGVPANREWRYQAASLQNWPYANIAADSSPSPRDPIITVKRTRWELRPVYHATMRYIYTLPLLEEALTKLNSRFASLALMQGQKEQDAQSIRSMNAEMEDLARLDSLGVRVDPGIVWDAIPLSFIVDWFVDVSSFLHSFARDNFPIQTTVTDFCHSLAYRYESQILQQFNCNTTANFVPAPFSEWTDIKHRLRQNGIVYRRTFSAYDRVRHTPGTHMVAIKRLKLRQAAIAGSLLLTRTVTARR